MVGVPSLGAETAAGLGVDLDRLALVPFPGTSWLEVVAALIEAVDIVVVRPPPRVFDADARRLAARVRQRGAVLVVLGQWPGCELRLTVTGSQWTGLGAGHGLCSPGRSRCPRSVVARPVDHVSLGCGFPIPMGTFVRSKRPPQLVPSPRATSIALMLSPVGRDERDERDDEMTMPIRTLVIWFPDWPVIAAAHEVGCPPEAPIAVLDKGRVLACSSTARAEGVRRGLRTREAQSRCPDLVVLKHDPVVDVRAFEPIVAAVEEFAPGVEIIRSGTCAVGARGPTRYFGGESALVEQLHGHLGTSLAKEPIAEHLGPFHIGLADGPFAAEQAARLAWRDKEWSRVVESGRSAEFLAPLSVDTLERPELVGLLRRLGIRTLGAFAALPTKSVLSRFGVDGALAHRLAGGRDERLLAGRRPPPELTVTLQLEPVVDRVDTVAFAARGHAEQLITQLAARDLVCTCLRIELRTERPEEISRQWRHPRWFSAADVVDRLRWQLQGASSVSGSPGAPQVQLSAGVELVRLIPEEVDPIGQHQEGLWGDRAPDEQVHRALTRVQSMLGHTAVVTAVPVGGRGYLERMTLLPWGDSGPSVKAGGSALSVGRKRSPVRRAPVRRRQAGTPSIAAKIRAERPTWPGHLPSPAPATVLPTPHPALVLDAVGQPVEVNEREVLSAAPASFDMGSSEGNATGRGMQQIVSWAGPWVADEREWDPRTARRRAWFQVVCADGMAWLLALEKGRWWVEGGYD